MTTTAPETTVVEPQPQALPAVEAVEQKDATTTDVEKTDLSSSSGSIDFHNQHVVLGDDSDGHVQWTSRRLLASLFLAMLYTGSQILLYFAGGSLHFIVEDIGNESAMGWLPTANTLAIAAVCPFVGYLQDLFGKRYIALFGALLLCLGCLLLGLSHSYGMAVVGMALAGAGAGIGELTGLAGLSETVPVKHRGYGLAVLTAIALPFAPYQLYSQLLSTRATWRWGAWISLIYNGLTAIGLLIFYFPKNHTRTEGLSWGKILKQVDFLGGALSIIGLTLFLVALQAGGYSASWSSAYVLCTLLIGFFTLVVWIVWEVKFAKHPMTPPKLFQEKVVSLAFVVAFIAGINFFSMLNFWPMLITNVYEPDPVKIGLRGFALAICVIFGAVFFNSLLSLWRGKSGYVLFIASVLLTAFIGALSVVSPENERMTLALGSIGGIGIGGLMVPSATVAIVAAPDSLITTCAALSLAVRAVGGSIGYSIYFNVFKDKLTAYLPEQVVKHAVLAGLPAEAAPKFVMAFLGAPEVLAGMPGVTPAILAGATKGTQWAYALALRYVWWTTIPFGVLAMVCSLLIPDTSKFETNRVAVAL